MTAEVVALRGERLPGKPDEDVVERLEGLLADARSGKLIAVGYALVNEDQSWTTGWVGAAGTRYQIGVAVSWLAQRYIKALTE